MDQQRYPFVCSFVALVVEPFAAVGEYLLYFFSQFRHMLGIDPLLDDVQSCDWEILFNVVNLLDDLLRHFQCPSELILRGQPKDIFFSLYQPKYHFMHHLPSED